MKQALKNKRLVISLGGSLLVPELPPKKADFRQYADLLVNLFLEGHKVLAVCGGGELARTYQRFIPYNVATNTERDLVGIAATKLNAATLNTMLGSASTIGTIDYALVPKYYNKSRIIICVGGEKPGHSTDWDAVYLAKKVNADLIINATNVEGICNKDPNTCVDAILIPKLKYEQYLQKFGKDWEPGMRAPFDFEATKLMLTYKKHIPTAVVNGTKLENILKAIKSQKVGTLLY